jgi:hypothetical protein
MKQKSFLRLKSGSLGETTFVGTKDGYRVQEKKEMSPERFKTDPAFERVRENNSEFKTAAAASGLLRLATNPQVRKGHDGRVVSRLLTSMLKVVKADTVSAPGLRNFMDGDLKYLKGFQFNDNVLTRRAFQSTIPHSINRVTGELSINLASFIPTYIVQAEPGVTHFELEASAYELDLEQNTYKVDVKSSGSLPWNNVATAVINLVTNLTPNSTLPLMLVFGIRFYLPLAGGMRPYLQGKNDAFTILDIVKP